MTAARCASGESLAWRFVDTNNGCAFGLMRASLRGLLFLRLLQVKTLFTLWTSDDDVLGVVPSLETSLLEISLGLLLQLFGFDKAFVLLSLASRPFGARGLGGLYELRAAASLGSNVVLQQQAVATGGVT